VSPEIKEFFSMWSVLLVMVGLVAALVPVIVAAEDQMAERKRPVLPPSDSATPQTAAEMNPMYPLAAGKRRWVRVEVKPTNDPRPF
jgi:hypothetical protein